MTPEIRGEELERKKAEYAKRTVITAGLDMAALKDTDEVIGKYKTETTVF